MTLLVPETPLTILHTPLDRHIENDLYPRGVEPGAALCGDPIDGVTVKRVRLLRVPTAAVCARCIRIARQWCGWWYFEPWDCIQRRRLLDNLTKDLATWR